MKRALPDMLHKSIYLSGPVMVVHVKGAVRERSRIK